MNDYKKEKISTFYSEQYARESMRHEQERAGILGVLFFIGIIISFKFTYLLELNFPPFTNRSSTKVLTTFMFIMMVYEFLLWYFIGQLRKKGFTVPLPGKFVNATVEVSVISLVLFLLSREFPHPVAVMHSPLSLGYFFFIILCTLRLNFSLSVYTGVISGLNYALLGLYLASVSGSSPNEIIDLPFVYVVKGIIIALCGATAAYVTHKIKLSIRSSIKTLERQNQVINMFGQQISKEVVDVMLQEKGDIESKLMRVCVLFIDIRDFSMYAEKHNPNEVVEYQNAFFKIVIEVVNKYKGIINQFLGDGCMITFGAPLVLKNSCENAVKAGLEIVEKVKNSSELKKFQETKIGIGIHVGDAVTGNLGTDLRQQYSITGNVVILACRIEQLNKDLNSQLLISQEVKECLSFLPEGTEEIGLVRVKGREEGVYLYKLV